jgi:hypothetical protein
LGKANSGRTIFDSSPVFFGVCWHLLGVVDDLRVFPVIAGIRLISLAFVGNCGELWAISVFDAGFLGISAGFLGMERDRLERKGAVEDGKLCG